MKTFNDVMLPYFNQLGIDPIEFTYNEKTNKYVTKESFQNDDNDPEAYYIVIQMNNRVGNVTIGTSDGLKFNEQETLGQIMYQDGNWINL